MADFDPLDILNIESITSRLRMSATQSTNWLIWKEPSAPLAIDRYVTVLVNRDQAPKLRAREDLALFHDLACPYAIARDGTFRAAFHAYSRSLAKDHRTAATAALKAFAKNVDAARTRLLELHSHLARPIRESAIFWSVADLF